MNLLGGFSISINGTLTIHTKHKKASAILAYLAMKRDTGISRERVAGLLWSEQPESAARAALRQCLRRLQLQLSKSNVNILELEGQALCLAKNAVTSDIDEISTQLERGNIPKQLVEGFMREDLLNGFDDLDPSFTAWLRVTRQDWSERVLKMATAVMKDASNAMSNRMDAASLLFRTDPTDETAARLLISENQKRGNQSAALTVYAALWDALDEAWGEEPTPELQRMIVDMRTAAEQASPARVIIEDKPLTLVVRNFEQSGPWSMPNYLIAGFRRELIAALVRFREWIVLDDTSNPDADYYIEALYRDGLDAAQLTISVIGGKEKAYIASNAAKLSYDSWVGALQHVIRNLSAALNLHVSRQRLSLIGSDDALEASSVDLWLEANNLLGHWRVDNYVKAENLFREIIERSPLYAPAYSSIANVNNCRHLIEPGQFRRQAWSETAKHYALRSIELDPIDSRNQLSLAWSHAMTSRFGQAEQAFDLAHTLNPNNPRTLLPSAHGLSFCGLHDEANRLVDEALKADYELTAAHWGYAACVRYLAGRYDEAIEAGNRAENAIIDINCWRAAAHAMVGDKGEAARLIDDFILHARENWEGSKEPTVSRIADWFVQCFPINRPEDVDHLREGIEISGLRVSTQA